MLPLDSTPTLKMEMPLSAKLLAQKPPTEQLTGKQLPGSFTSLLADGVNQVNELQQNADAQVHEMLTGGDVTQVEVFSAVQKSDMAFRLLVQVRNKLMSAYEEINAIRI